MKKILLSLTPLLWLNYAHSQCTTPSSVTATPSAICAGSTTSLNAISVGSSINWYTVPVGGVATGSSASGANFAVSPVVTTTYYAEAFVNGAANTQTFNYTGAIQSYTVPAGVTSITIDARGAQGGGSNGGGGGLGARMVGTYTTVPGTVLSIVVPSMGLLQVGGNSQNSSGGGGGAFVYSAGPTLLVAAGGGGGKCNYLGSPGLHPGAAGTVAANGNASNDGYAGGVGGLGGTQSPYGGGGAGWLANGAGPFGGVSFPNWTGGVGGCGFGGGGCGGAGGFGGGGGGGNAYGGGGGGGGYSGGGAGSDPNHGGGGGSFSSGTNQSNTSGSQSGNGQVIISYSVTGCVNPIRVAVTVTVNANPTITVASGSICTGQSYTMSPSGANTYTFSGGNAVVSPTANTSYSVTGTSTAGCISQSVAICNVTVMANPTVAITGGIAVVCAGTPINLTASGANSYSWNTGAVTSTIAPTPTANASYTVIGTSSITGCSANAVKAVTVTPAPALSVTGAGTICAGGQTATLTVSGANTYSWNTGSTSASIVVTPTTTTTYTANGTSTVTGCTGIITAIVTVDPCTGLSNTSAALKGLSVYPNPSNGEFTIELNNGLDKTIEVTDYTGKVVLKANTNKNQFNVNISTLANGIYNVKVQSNNAVSVIRVVKQ